MELHFHSPVCFMESTEINAVYRSWIYSWSVCKLLALRSKGMFGYALKIEKLVKFYAVDSQIHIWDIVQENEWMIAFVYWRDNCIYFKIPYSTLHISMNKFYHCPCQCVFVFFFFKFIIIYFDNWEIKLFTHWFWWLFKSSGLLCHVNW